MEFVFEPNPSVENSGRPTVDNSMFRRHVDFYTTTNGDTTEELRREELGNDLKSRVYIDLLVKVK